MGYSMINVTFTGNIFHENGTPALDVRYQGFFIKENTNSSNTVWDTPRSTETNQYNFNLGDSTWLSQENGYAIPNDKVLLCFWKENTSDREDTNLTEWCFIEWILDDSDVYLQNIQLKGPQHPNCLFELHDNTVGSPVTIENIGSNNDVSWLYAGKLHHQSYKWENYIIFDMNILPDPVTISWGDGHITTFPISASPYPHIYTSAGDYTINVMLQNHSGFECNTMFDARVLYEVKNGLEWDIPPSLNEPSTYTPAISGDLTRIQGVNYYIDGVLTHINFAYNQDFDHTFINPGNHLIKQCIKFNDGFDNQIQCKDFIIELATVANFASSNYDCGLVFTSTGVIGNPPITKFQWDVTDGLFILAHVEGSAYQDWYYNWPYTGTFRVRLAVTDSNGRTSSITKEYIVDHCLGVGSDTGGGGGGGSSPWVFAETKYIKQDGSLPIITISGIEGSDGEEIDMRILILEIVE
jgi:hypothetical protein